MDSEPPHSDRPANRISLRTYSLELTALSFAAASVVIVVLHQLCISDADLYRNRAFILTEFLVLFVTALLTVAAFTKAIILAFQDRKKSLIALAAAVLTGALFLFCFWYDSTTLLYAT